MASAAASSALALRPRPHRDRSAGIRCSGSRSPWGAGASSASRWNAARARRHGRDRDGLLHTADERDQQAYKLADAQSIKLHSKAEEKLAIKITMLRTLEQIRGRIAEAKGGQAPTLEEWASAALMPVSELPVHLKAAQSAKIQMIAANLRLVMHTAKIIHWRFARKHGVSKSDLVSAGILGLIIGVNRFDPQRGCRLSTYGWYWIYGTMLKEVSKQARVVKLPCALHWTMEKVTRFSEEMEVELMRELTLEELADRLGIPLARLRRVALCTSWNTVPYWTVPDLDTPDAGDDGGTSVQMVSNGGNMNAPVTPETHTDSNDDEEAGWLIDHNDYDTKQLIDDAMDAILTEREATILCMHFGLLHDGQQQERCYTLEELGSHYGVTRERIRQIEYRAKMELRRHLKASTTGLLG